jgi:L-threonylcarbamoyladenylate synthase
LTAFYPVRNRAVMIGPTADENEQIATRVVPADSAAIAEAVRVLRLGGLIAFPTETVYGLGADAHNGEAVARLYAAKGRPQFNPLIAHVVDRAAAERVGRIGPAAQRLADAFWPGPLTLVVPKMADCRISALALAGLGTVAVRVPALPIARELLQMFGGPIVAPSANRSGHVSPTTAQHVREDLAGRVDLILDGGPTSVGLESTIVACVADQPLLLRPGGVSRTDLERVLGGPLESAVEAAEENGAVRPAAPGQLASHYAPRTPLRLNAESVSDGEVLLAFGTQLPPGAAKAVAALNLSESGDLIEAAANLFAHLRALDAVGAKAIVAMRVPDRGLGEAINDRLRRAAA